MAKRERHNERKLNVSVQIKYLTLATQRRHGRMGGIEKVWELPITYLGGHFVAGELSAVRMSCCVPHLVKLRWQDQARDLRCHGCPKFVRHGGAEEVRRYLRPNYEAENGRARKKERRRGSGEGSCLGMGLA